MKPFDPRLLKYARETRAYIVFLIFVGIVMTALITAQTFLIAAAISPIFYNKGTLKNTALYILGIALIFTLRAGINFLQNAFAHRAGMKIITALRTQVLKHAGNLGERWLANGNTARVVTLTTRGLDDLEPYFVSFLPQLFLSVTAIPALIIIILWLDWISAIAIICCIPLIPIFMILIGKMTAKFSSQRLQAMQQLGDQLLDLLAGLTTLKAVGREAGPKQRVTDLGKAFAEKTMQTLYVAFLSGAVLEFLATLSTAIVAVEVGFRMVGGDLLLFKGLIIIILTPEVFKPLREVGSQFHASANGVAAAAQAFEILETPLPQTTGKTKIPDLNTHSIFLENINVYAPHRATVAPANLNSEIKPNEITVLMGTSGAGKSTTVSLLLNLLTPDRGSIKIGDTPLSEIAPEEWWQNITWVPQRPVLVPATVAENMGVSDPANCPELLAAAEITGFTEVVNNLSQGWNALIGQGGVGLSVGQRQRLALTRALLTKKKIVILDEPSAHLDALTETHVSETIKKLKTNGHTVIVIAHRKALSKLADNIIIVNSSTRDLVALNSGLQPTTPLSTLVTEENHA